MHQALTRLPLQIAPEPSKQTCARTPGKYDASCRARTIPCIPPSLPNHHFLLIRCAAYLVVDIYFAAIQCVSVFNRCGMKIIIHNNITDRDADVERSFFRYGNIFSNRRRAFNFNNLRMLFTVSTNSVML